MKPICWQPYWSHWYQTSPVAITMRLGKNVWGNCLQVLDNWTHQASIPERKTKTKTHALSPRFSWFPSKRWLPSMTQSLTIPLSLGNRHQSPGQLKWLKSIGQEMVPEKRKKEKKETQHLCWKPMRVWGKGCAMHLWGKTANDTGLLTAQRHDGSSSAFLERSSTSNAAVLAPPQGTDLWILSQATGLHRGHHRGLSWGVRLHPRMRALLDPPAESPNSDIICREKVFCY